MHAHVCISVHEEKGEQERVKPKKEEREETFPNESCFSRTWPDIALSINWNVS